MAQYNKETRSLIEEYHEITAQLKRYASYVSITESEMKKFALEESELLDRQAQIIDIYASLKLNSIESVLDTLDLWEASECFSRLEVPSTRRMILNVKGYLGVCCPTT